MTARVQPEDNSSPDATCSSGKQNAIPDPEGRTEARIWRTVGKHARILVLWLSCELLMPVPGIYRPAEVTGRREGRCVIRELAGASDESFSPVYGMGTVAGTLVSNTLTSCLEKKCIASKSSIPCPWRPQDPSSVVVNVSREWMVRVLALSSSQKPPTGKPQWLPSPKSSSKTVQDSDGRSQEHPYLRLGTPSPPPPPEADAKTGVKSKFFIWDDISRNPLRGVGKPLLRFKPKPHMGSTSPHMATFLLPSTCPPRLLNSQISSLAPTPQMVSFMSQLEWATICQIFGLTASWVRL